MRIIKSLIEAAMFAAFALVFMAVFAIWWTVRVLGLVAFCIFLEVRKLLYPRKY